MKYIRTKDGRIIDVSNVILQDGLTIKDIKDISEETGFVACYKGVEIIKYANTIEELCDELVYYDLEEECMQILSPSFNKWLILNDLKDGRIKDNNVYGAIWTEKGLIYVAKMNDKGELELL